MDIEALNDSDIAAVLGYAADDSINRDPNVLFPDIGPGFTSILTDFETHLPSGDTALTIEVTDMRGRSRTFTARITVTED